MKTRKVYFSKKSIKMYLWWLTCSHSYNDIKFIYLKATGFPRILNVIWPFACLSTSLTPSSSESFCNCDGIWLLLSVWSPVLSSSCWLFSFFVLFSSVSSSLFSSLFSGLSFIASDTLSFPLLMDSFLMLRLLSSSPFSPSIFSSSAFSLSFKSIIGMVCKHITKSTVQ